MAESHNFRSAFHGFNREDVVRYIEYLNQKHNSCINQLKSENKALKDELEALQKSNTSDAEKDALIAQLQSQLSQMSATGESSEPSAELEAYRRAERAERAAKERAEQVYFQATATLSEAAVRVEEATKEFDGILEQLNAQSAQLHSAVASGKTALQEAADTMYAIRPKEE